MKQLIDNFSSGSDEYARYRPESPAEIFDFLYARANGFEAAWDCGTGNGQVATKLAEQFTNVYGTDISTEQLEKATQKNNVQYLLERAEQTSLRDKSVNLITVAQAIHWFDFEKFYIEVGRVARPGAILAAWTYTALRFGSPIDDVVDELYTDVTGAYWDKERNWVDARYSTIPFPFRSIETPVFKIERDMTLAQLEGYLRTWSGVKHYVKKEGRDPVSLITDKLKKAWGNVETNSAVWPVHMRAGYVD